MRGGGRGRAAQPRGLEEEQRDGREQQEDGPPPREQPRCPLPQAARRGLPLAGAGPPRRRRRRRTVFVGDGDGDASDHRRRHREESGGAVVAAVGSPFSRRMGSRPASNPGSLLSAATYRATRPPRGESGLNIWPGPSPQDAHQ